MRSGARSRISVVVSLVAVASSCGGAASTPTTEAPSQFELRWANTKDETKAEICQRYFEFGPGPAFSIVDEVEGVTFDDFIATLKERC